MLDNYWERWFNGFQLHNRSTMTMRRCVARVWDFFHWATAMYWNAENTDMMSKRLLTARNRNDPHQVDGIRIPIPLIVDSVADQENCNTETKTSIALLLVATWRVLTVDPICPVCGWRRGRKEESPPEQESTTCRCKSDVPDGFQSSSRGTRR